MESCKAIFSRSTFYLQEKKVFTGRPLVNLKLPWSAVSYRLPFAEPSESIEPNRVNFRVLKLGQFQTDLSSTILIGFSAIIAAYGWVDDVMSVRTTE